MTHSIIECGGGEVERISTPLVEVGVENMTNQKQGHHQIDHTNHETPERTH